MDALRETSLLEMPLEDALAAKRSDIETYLFFCADALDNAERTRTKKLVSIRCFYAYVLDQNETLQTSLKQNPAERIHRPKAPKKQPIFLSEQDCTSLLRSVNGKDGIRDYTVLLLILTCGLRVSETVNLKYGDIDFDARTVRIHGKGNKERTAFLTPMCVRAMQDYHAEYRVLILREDCDNPDAYFFLSQKTGEKLTTRTIQRIMRKHSLAAGIGGKGYTPHKLRHTTATMLAKDGKELLAIQHILGHESPATTQIYTHLEENDIAQTVTQSCLMDLGK